MVQLTPLDPSR